MKKVIFWDFDGTLAKAPFLWSSSLFSALTSILPESNLTLEEVRNYTKSGFTWDTPEQDYSKLIGDKWWEHILNYFVGIYRKLGIPEEYIIKLSLLAMENVKDVKRYQLYDDAVMVLEGVRTKGYQSYILSNHIPELKEIVVQLGISAYFEDYIISSVVGYDKPRPEIFEYAKHLAGNPEICYMIGDNPKADIIGGNSASMKTILVHKDIESPADYTCNELVGILDVIT